MADMARRRSSGTSNESRKRKFDDREDETEADNTTVGISTDYPCHYCTSIFVTQISLNRHVLTFHDGERQIKKEESMYENDADEIEINTMDLYPNFDEEQENGSEFYTNEDDYYLSNVAEKYSTDTLEIFEDTKPTNELQLQYPRAILQPDSNVSAPVKNGTPKLTHDDISSVLAQADEIANNSISEFVNCPLCRKTFGKKELSIHISCEHGGAKFSCPYCGRTISRRDHLKRHIKNVHPEMCTETEIGPFPRNLNLCRANNNNTTGQQKRHGPLVTVTHLSTPTQENDILSPLLPISIVAPRIAANDEDDEDDFEGEELNSNVTMKSLIENSEESQDSMQITVEPDLPFHDLNDIDYNDEEYENPNFLMEQFHEQKFLPNSNIQTVSVLKCGLCNAIFNNRILLERHEATHGELRPHKCNVCGKGFLRKEHLSKHLSSVHSGMKFTCEFCGKDISRKDHLIRHIRNVHPDQFYSLPQDAVQEFVAQPQLPLTLPMSFKTAASLQPKPKKPFFNCDMCEATFINVDDLHAHQATVHADVRKYKCNYCCKAFKRKEHLTKHEVLHTGERKFTCRVCGNDFMRKDALQEHIKRTHGLDSSTSIVTVNNPTSSSSSFPCNLCDKMFQDRGSLLSHMTTVHGLIVNSPPGLPKNSQQRHSIQNNLKGHAQKFIPKQVQSLSANNLGSLMDLINKGSITLSFQPIKSEHD